MRSWFAEVDSKKFVLELGPRLEGKMGFLHMGKAVLKGPFFIQFLVGRKRVTCVHAVPTGILSHAAASGPIPGGVVVWVGEGD